MIVLSKVYNDLLSLSSALLVMFFSTLKYFLINTRALRRARADEARGDGLCFTLVEEVADHVTESYEAGGLKPQPSFVSSGICPSIVDFFDNSE